MKETNGEEDEASMGERERQQKSKGERVKGKEGRAIPEKWVNASASCGDIIPPHPAQAHHAQVVGCCLSEVGQFVHEMR